MARSFRCIMHQTYRVHGRCHPYNNIFLKWRHPAAKEDIKCSINRNPIIISPLKVCLARKEKEKREDKRKEMV